MLRLRTVGFPHSRLGCADLSPVPEFSQSSHLARHLCPAEGGRGGSCCPRGSRKLCQGRTLDRSLTRSSCSPACPCSVLCQQLFLPQLHHGPCRAAEAQPGWAPPLWFSLSLPILEGLFTWNTLRCPDLLQGALCPCPPRALIQCPVSTGPRGSSLLLCCFI